MGFVTVTKASTKFGDKNSEYVLVVLGLTPAPTIATMPAMRIEKQAGMQSHERLSRVRGKEQSRIGIVKIPL